MVSAFLIERLHGGYRPITANTLYGETQKYTNTVEKRQTENHLHARQCANYTYNGFTVRFIVYGKGAGMKLYLIFLADCIIWIAEVVAYAGL